VGRRTRSSSHAPYVLSRGGGEAYKRHRKSKSKRHAYRRFVLTRLHVRACQVSDEVITLLENGFADGAMARWRTLHELGVVATLIADGDERLAERYIHHDAVDVKRQANDYEQVQVPIGYPPLSPNGRPPGSTGTTRPPSKSTANRSPHRTVGPQSGSG